MNDEYHYIMNNFAPLHGHILKQEIYTTPACSILFLNVTTERGDI